jgi:hypothetical protein
MKHALPVILFLVALVAPMRTLAEPQERTSTVVDRQLVNLTVYNGGSALVHDRRRVTLNAGINHLAWRDVSASMDPTSALLDPIGNDRLTVLEQNFDYDLLESKRASAAIRR